MINALATMVWFPGFWGGWSFWLFPLIFPIIMLPFWFIRPLFWRSDCYHDNEMFARHHHLDGKSQSKSSKNALDILDEEYAKGNISDDDYKIRKTNLQK